MATTDELIAERAQLVLQLTAVNSQILAVIGQKTKKYTYSNQETTHQAENVSLAELRDMKKYIMERLSQIDSVLNGRGYFIQVKNC